MGFAAICRFCERWGWADRFCWTRAAECDEMIQIAAADESMKVQVFLSKAVLPVVHLRREGCLERLIAKLVGETILDFQIASSIQFSIACRPSRCATLLFVKATGKC